MLSTENSLRSISRVDDSRDDTFLPECDRTRSRDERLVDAHGRLGGDAAERLARR